MESKAARLGRIERAELHLRQSHATLKGMRGFGFMRAALARHAKRLLQEARILERELAREERR